MLQFGLINAPSELQRLMVRVVEELKGPEVSVYLNDILITTETEERLLEVLKETLTAFRRANLKGKPQKCRFMESCLEAMWQTEMD